MNEIIPYVRFVETIILAGWSNNDVMRLLNLYRLSINEPEIDWVREKLYETPAYETMTKENKLRFMNNEPPTILDNVTNNYEYSDDFCALVFDFSNAKPLQKRGKLSIKDLADILYSKNLRRAVECFAMLHEDIDSLNPLLTELSLKHITKNVYKRYLYWFWDCRGFSQQEFASYLHANRSVGLYFSYINPLIHNTADILQSFGKISVHEIMRKNNIIFHQIQKKINSALDNGTKLNPRDISLLFSVVKVLRKYDTSRPPDDIETDIDKKYDRFMRQEKILKMPLHDIFLVPHNNLIRCLIYTGHKLEEIEEIMHYFGFNHIPECFFNHIYRECTSFAEGKQMVEENQKRLPLKEPLFNSAVVRKTFRYREIFNAVMKWPGAIKRLRDISISNLIFDRNKRRLLECALIVGMSFKRLFEAWKECFNEKLTRNEYKLYKYHCWNISGFDFEQGLYQYLQQNPKNHLYMEYKSFLGKDPIDIMSHFGLVNTEERKQINKNLYGKLLLEQKIAFQNGVHSLPKWIPKELARLEKKFTSEEKEMDNEYYRTQLERIFAKITGKTRYHLTLDEIKNKRHLKKVPEKDESNEHKHNWEQND